MLSFKDSTHSWFVRIVFFVVLIVFAFFGVYSYLSNENGISGRYIAKAGSVALDYQKFERDFQQFYASNAELKKQSSEEQARRYFLENLINRALLAQYAEDLGLVSSSQEVAKKIFAEPNFQTDGRFDRRKYNQFLQQSGTTSGEFETQLMHGYQTQSLGDFLMLGFGDNTEDVSRFWKVSKASRVVKWAEVKFDALPKKEPSTPQEEENFFKANAENYKIPINYTIEYVVLWGDEPIFGKPLEPKLEELKKYYEENKTVFTQTEGFHASHIFFSKEKITPEKLKLAQKIKEELKKNPSLFVSYVKKYSEDKSTNNRGGDLGWAAYGDFLENFEKEVKSLKKGQLSDLVETQLGYHIILLKDIRKSTLLPFEEGKVRSSFLQQTAKNRMEKEAATWKKGKNAADFKKWIESQNKSANLLKDYSAENFSRLPFGANLYEELKNGAVGSVGAILSNIGLVVYHLQKISPERLASYADVKDRVHTDFAIFKVFNDLNGQIIKKNKELNTEAGFDAFLKTLRLTSKKTTLQRIGKQSFEPVDANPELKSAIFIQNKANPFLYRRVGDQFFLIYLLEVKTISSFPPEELKAVKENLKGFWGNYFYGVLLGDLRRRYNITYNTPLMKQLGIATEQK